MPDTCVLIVDDNLLNIELAGFLLQEAGMTVAAVSDAALVLPLVAARRPQLVLMDIQLPGSDGLALAAQIKADPALGPIAVVAFTAHAMHGDEARMRAAGCDGYIAKPIDVGRFVAQVRACLPT